MNYLLDFRYQNSFLKTANDNNAVVVKAWENNYQAHRKIGATGRLTACADPGFAIALATYTGPTVQIPRWTVFTDQSQQLNAYSTADCTYFNGTIVGFRTLIALDVPVNLGNGLIGFNVFAHGFPVGQLLTIQGTASYDGDYIINAATSTNQIVIQFAGTFVLDTFDGTEKLFTGIVYIPVSEGIPQSFTYISNGTVNENITIFDDSADENQVQITVVDGNGAFLYNVTITTDIFLINSVTNYNCSIQSLPSFQGFVETFGDGVTSRKLNTGENILTLFARTQGAAGDIIGTGVVTQAKSPITDTSGNQASIFFTNLTPIVGGKDYEDIESTRHNSRNLFEAGYRACNFQDWITILNSQPTIQKSIVWTDADLNNFTVGFTNSIVYVSAVSTLGGPLTQSEEADIVIALKQSKQSETDIVQFQTLDVINAQFRINAVLNPVPTGPIIQNIYNALVAKYGILDTDFNVSIFESQAWSIIQSADPNLLYHDTEVWHCERSEDYPALDDSVASHTVVVSLTSAIEPNANKQIYFVSGKVELWIRRTVGGVLQNVKRIGVCDSVTPSLFIGDNGYTILGGNVNYSENQVTWNILDIINDTPIDGGTTFGVQNPTSSDPDGYVLRLTYQTQNANGALINDIRLPYFFDITDVKFEDIEQYFNFTYTGS